MLLTYSLKRMTGLLAIILSLLPIAASTVDVPTEVMRLHRDAIICDLHADTQFMITYMSYDMSKRHRSFNWGPAGVGPMFSDIDIPRLREGGVDLFTMAICPSPKNNERKGSAAFVKRSLNALDRMLVKNSDSIAPALSPSGAREIIFGGRIAALLAVEGGQAIENDLENLREFYRRGVRYMTITHVKNLDWAESANDENDPEIDGLTDFGRDVIHEMDRLGIMIDLAHVSEETFWAVLKTTDSPVIVTHAGARGIADHPRNLTDEQIKAVAERGGVIGVIFHEKYLDPTGKKKKDVGLIVDHIDYIKNVAGVDVIALGSDFDGGVKIPPDIGHAGRMPALTAELVRRGYTNKEIRKILGENFLRTWALVVGEKR